MNARIARGVLIPLLGVAAVSWGLEPGAKSKIDMAEVPAKVEFLAIGYPSAFKIHGRIDAEKPMKGTMLLNDQGIEGEVSLELDQFDTGIGLRNKHLREKYLETDKHPKAVLKFTKLLLPGVLRQDAIEARDVPFEAALTLHGKTRNVTGTARFKREGKAFDMAFAFSLKTSDYGITTPKFMKVTVGEEVNVTVEGKTTL